MMAVVAALMVSALAAAAGQVSIVQAPDAPVRLDRANVLTAADAPPVLLYAATNVTNDQIDEFTVMVYVFRDGVLKARQVAPGRRTLDAHATKYSAMVLDGFPIEPTDVVVIGVNQAQRVGSDAWWRADLHDLAAEAAAKRGKP
jgi:hypothetical protein